MKELEAIIDEQSQLLMWNGYHENVLRNGEPLGSYKEHLKLAVQDLLDKGDFLPDFEPFEVRLFGNFNHGKDKVLFTFSYQYDGLLSQINLKQVEARLDGVPIVINVEKGSDLWSSEEMYARVKQLGSTINSALNEERVAELKKLVSDESSLLAKCGYINQSLANSLEAAIQKAQSEPDKVHHFRITGKLKTGKEMEVMHYKLFYRYHPPSNSLKFKEVNARIGNISETFLGTRLYPVPRVDDMSEYLVGKRNSHVANQIIQHQSPINDPAKRISK